MDILIVTQDFPPERGGIQTYVLELARAFLARGHKVRVICPGRESDPDPLLHGGRGLADLVRLPIHSSWLFLRLLTYLPRYLKRNPSVEAVLYAQWQPALAELLLPGSRRKHRSYCLVHGRELLTSVLGPLAPPLMRLAFGRMRAAFPNSAEVLRMTRTRAAPACPLHLVHPGVDPEHFRPVDAGFLRDRYGFDGNGTRTPIVYCITRMVARKNLLTLVEAMPGVRAEVPGAVLLLAGDGPEKASLVNRAQALGLGEGVRFLGRIADAEMVAHYCLADVFALPSMSLPRDIEGFGIVFLEAGACEVPVVGSLAGGIPDAVEAGVTGLLVPPEDGQKLKDALVELLKNRARAREMGQCARIRIEKGFTWAHAADRILAFMS